ncbi:hypothetical protein ACVJBD_001028 [Rhizobium mongolense]
MTRAQTAPVLLACLAALSACNTTDALTPQVDIGDSSLGRSSPVTQREVERMAGSEPTRAFAGESRQAGYHPAYNNQTYRSGPGAPPTTMQEQADALARRGPSPAASPPVEGRTLAEPVSNAQAEEEDMGNLAPARQQKRVAAIDPAASSAIGGNTVRFLPIIGAPVQAVTPLSPPARSRGALARSLDQEFERHQQRLYPEGLPLGLYRRRQCNRRLRLGYPRRQRRPPAPHPGTGKGAFRGTGSLGRRSCLRHAADRHENDRRV